MSEVIRQVELERGRWLFEATVLCVHERGLAGSVTKSKLILPTARWANILRDKLLGQGIATCLKSQCIEKTVDSCPKDPSCLS